MPPEYESRMLTQGRGKGKKGNQIFRPSDVPIPESRSFVSLRVLCGQRFGFPMTRDVGDHPIFCSPLPASFSQRPTPHRRFVDNKSQSAIRPSGDRAVEVLFLRFSAFQSGAISAFFSGFNCPVGRGSQLTLTPPPAPLCTPNFTQGHPIHPRIGRGSQTGSKCQPWLNADCRVLTANFQRSSTIYP